MGSFDDNRRLHADAVAAFRTWRSGWSRRVPIWGCNAPLARFPFVPADREALEQDCYEGYNIQVTGLVQRLRATGIKRVVIGVSGGLDSTHALIVAAQAMDRLGLPRTNILAFTMPGFATGEHTKTNALALMGALGATGRELDIRPTATTMLEELGHPFAAGKPVYDVTFENVQAGLRTDYLFRLANHHGAIVLGTGDLSEVALGWCTYGVGDQMSHYNVNAGVPKTLIQHLIRWVISSRQFARDVLGDAGVDPGDRDLAGAGAGGRRRDAAEHRGEDRSLRAAGFQSVLHAAVWFSAVEDRLPGADGVGGSGARRLAARLSRPTGASRTH